jgi:hypothetical protein
MISFDQANAAVHYPPDRRFRIWIRHSWPRPSGNHLRTRWTQKAVTLSVAAHLQAMCAARFGFNSMRLLRGWLVLRSASAHSAQSPSSQTPQLK